MSQARPPCGLALLREQAARRLLRRRHAACSSPASASASVGGVCPYAGLASPGCSASNPTREGAVHASAPPRRIRLKKIDQKGRGRLSPADSRSPDHKSCGFVAHATKPVFHLRSPHTRLSQSGGFSPCWLPLTSLMSNLPLGSDSQELG